jgi:hypothetical protein
MLTILIECELISAKPDELPIKARAIALICPGPLALSEEFGSLQFVCRRAGS